MFFAPVISAPLAGHSLRTLDRDFQRFAASVLSGNDWRNGYRLEQDEKSWTLSLDAPGIAKEDLSVLVEDAVVRISTKAESKRALNAAYELPGEVDASASTVKLENGVLTLTLGKKVPVSRAVALSIA